jgi:hypothetical protein
LEREAVNPEETGEIQRPDQEATAPEEAADRIITEATETADDIAALAPTRSVRPPQQRPEAPAPRPAETATSAQSADIESALNEAMDAQAPTAPSGPPMTAGERDALRLSVSKCWNVGSLSSDALNTTVVVAVSMAEDGRPETGTIRMLSSSGGNAASARQAFEAARRAIIRCGAGGFDLPREKYAQWREVEMTFNPESMRIR